MTVIFIFTLKFPLDNTACTGVQFVTHLVRNRSPIGFPSIRRQIRIKTVKGAQNDPTYCVCYSFRPQAQKICEKMLKFFEKRY